MKTLITALVLSGAALVTDYSHAGSFPHSDVQVVVEGGAITTGRVDFDEPGEPIIPDVRVFTATLGNGFPHFSPNPGFNAPSGSGLPAGSTLTFNILDALRKYDPVGMDFDEIPAETMNVSLAAVSRTTPTTPDTFVAGFAFAAASGSGSIHQHINFFLNPPQGAGVYLLKLELVSSSGSIAPSEPFYFLFNDGRPVSEFEDALAVVETLLTPACPGDIDGSNTVDVDDLNGILSNWLVNVGVGSPLDLANDDGVITVDDLNVVLSNWQNDCG
ncbi:MAG: hypothetical protein KDA30_14950 [Phycisphaerales bacterium]|nr:hypothetical protein [Phycisphaerales bacterium]